MFKGRMMVWMIFWFAFSVIVGVAAARRGRSGIVWFLSSLLLSPLLTVIALLLYGELGPSNRTHKKCPECAEFCAIDARVCKHCGYRYAEPLPQAAEAVPMAKGRDPMDDAANVFFLVIALAIAAVLLYASRH